jgi:CO dehydrogenase maturation factor
MDALADKYAYVVIDNEAGMEHLSRRTTRKMDKFFIITDFSPIGFETAARINDLSKDLDIKITDTYLIINRIPDGVKATKDHPRIKELIDTEKFTEIFFIPNDDKLMEHAFSGKSLLELAEDSPMVRVVNDIIKRTSMI